MVNFSSYYHRCITNLKIVGNKSKIYAGYICLLIVLISFYFIHKRLECSTFNLLKRDTYVINIINKTETVSERFGSSP